MPLDTKAPEPEWNPQETGYWKCPQGYAEYVRESVVDHRHDNDPVPLPYYYRETDKNGVFIIGRPTKPVCIADSAKSSDHSAS